MNQGAFANATGSGAENLLACILRERGYEFERHCKICKSVYGHAIRVDFFITNIPAYPHGLVIECKWQDVAGSVDEKFPYLVLNIKERFPCPAIIVVDGRGQRDGAITWLKNQVDGDKLISVLDISEFYSFVTRKLDTPGKIIEVVTAA